MPDSGNHQPRIDATGDRPSRLQSTTAPAPVTPPTGAARVIIPYGTPVPEKPGFVTSRMPHAGYVDVWISPSGTPRSSV